MLSYRTRCIFCKSQKNALIYLTQFNIQGAIRTDITSREACEDYASTMLKQEHVL